MATDAATESSTADSSTTTSGTGAASTSPGTDGTGIEEGTGAATVAGNVGADMAETTWCGYASPANYSTSGNRTFFVNQSGDVLACRNNTAQYSGTTTVPTAGTAAFVQAGGMAGTVAANVTAADSEAWFVVN